MLYEISHRRLQFESSHQQFYWTWGEGPWALYDPNKSHEGGSGVNKFSKDNKQSRAVVVAQLVERLLATPEVHGLNPVICQIYIVQCLLSTVLKRRKKIKGAGNGPFFKKNIYLDSLSTNVEWTLSAHFELQILTPGGAKFSYTRMHTVHRRP